MSKTSLRLSVNEVEIRRGERRLIEGLRFALGNGEKALIVGPNGSGKTSLLRVIAGIAPCAAGEITLNGCKTSSLPPEDRVHVTYRGHLDGLKSDLTVRENLDFQAALRGRGDAVDGALEAVGLAGFAERPVRYLSAGQRRRVGLAALRASGAPLWILDEPMTNLDAAGRDLVIDWVNTHVEEGGLAVVATHQPETLAARGTLLVEL